MWAKMALIMFYQSESSRIGNIPFQAFVRGIVQRFVPEPNTSQFSRVNPPGRYLHRMNRRWKASLLHLTRIVRIHNSLAEFKNATNWFKYGVFEALISHVFQKQWHKIWDISFLRRTFSFQLNSLNLRQLETSCPMRDTNFIYRNHPRTGTTITTLGSWFNWIYRARMRGERWRP